MDEEGETDEREKGRKSEWRVPVRDAAEVELENAHREGPDIRL